MHAAKKGRLEIICGPMFSGKTEELMRRIKRAEIARQGILVLKHQLDQQRAPQACLVSHSGREHSAIPIHDDPQALTHILTLATPAITIVAIDEIQFFNPGILDVVTELINRGIRVIATGLDLDFRGEPFTIMPTLLAIADEVVKLKAICFVCHTDAYHTQRIVDEKPARYNDPLILVGAAECYEARCRDCFQIDYQTSLSSRHSVTT